jgi:mutator protein MutT
MKSDPHESPRNVAVGILQRGGRYLVSRRQPHAHQGGLWEFPGGGVEPEETLQSALRREISEEVRMSFAEAVLLHVEEHRYPDRTVRLHFFLCLDPHDDAIQEAIPSEKPRDPLPAPRWVTARELEGLPMPAGNAEVVRMLVEQHAE